MNSPLERVLAKLPGAKRQGNSYKAKCPAHDDLQASLSVSAGDDGRVLLKCFAGCEPKAVVERLGLQMSDLFAEKLRAATPARKRIVATYDYRDAGGELVYQAVRYEPKDFHQRRPDGKGGWTWSTTDIEPLPYRLPELLASDGLVLIVEGEKDVHALEALGFVSTCNSGGASKWKDTHAKHLAGRDAVVIPDHTKQALNTRRKSLRRWWASRSRFGW